MSMYYQGVCLDDMPAHILESISRKKTYAGSMPFLRLEENVAVFGADEPDENYKWSKEYGDRLVEPSQLRVDRRYWELLDKPENIVIMFQTPESAQSEQELFMWIYNKKLGSQEKETEIYESRE